MFQSILRYQYAMIRIFPYLSLCLLLCLPGCHLITGDMVHEKSVNTVSAPKHVNSRSLPHLYQWHDWLYTGGEPDMKQPEILRRELQQLGIQTIISVDGLPPAPMQEILGIKGIETHHLPMGYTGADTPTMGKLKQLINHAREPIYIHCHHGKHRAPAMAGIATILKEKWSNEQATNAMRTCGTSQDYLGLFSMVQHFNPNSLPATLKPTQTVAALPPESESQWMAQADRHYDQVKIDFKESRYNQHTAHQALLLHEALKEYQRVIEKGQYDKPFHIKLGDMIDDTADLTSLLKNKVSSRAHSKMAPDLHRLPILWRKIQSDCRGCHRRYRN